MPKFKKKQIINFINYKRIIYNEKYIKLQSIEIIREFLIANIYLKAQS